MFKTYIRNIFKEEKQDRVSMIATGAVERLNEACEIILKNIGDMTEQLATESNVRIIGPELVRRAVKKVLPREMNTRVFEIVDESQTESIVPLKRCRSAAKFSENFKIRRGTEVMLAAVTTAFIRIVIEDAVKEVANKSRATVTADALRQIEPSE